MRRSRPTPRIARLASAYTASRCARLPVRSLRLHESDNRGELSSLALSNCGPVFLERDETGLKGIRSGSSEISPRTGRFRWRARTGFSLGCVFQHDLSEAAVLERERCGCAGSRLLAIPLQRGAHCAKNEALRLCFGAADEREIAAAAWARRGLGQAGSAPRAAFQTHVSR